MNLASLSLNFCLDVRDRSDRPYSWPPSEMFGEGPREMWQHQNSHDSQ